MARLPQRHRLEFFEEILLRTARDGKNLASILTAGIDVACTEIKAEAGSIIVKNHRVNKLRFASVTGSRSAFLRRMTLKPGKGIAGWVISKGKMAVVSSVKSDPRYAPEFSEKIKFPTRKILCVPIRHGKTVIGALELINWKGSRPSRAKLDHIKAMATAIGQLLAAAR